MAYSNLIFQAHCQIDYLHNEIEDGATIEGCDGDAVTLVLADGSEMSIHLGPISDLLDALRCLRKG